MLHEPDVNQTTNHFYPKITCKSYGTRHMATLGNVSCCLARAGQLKATTDALLTDHLLISSAPLQEKLKGFGLI